MSDATRTVTVTTVTCGKASPSPATVTPGGPMTVTPATRPAVTGSVTPSRHLTARPNATPAVTPRRHPSVAVTVTDLVAFGTNPPGPPPPLPPAPKPTRDNVAFASFGVFVLLTSGGAVASQVSGPGALVLLGLGATAATVSAIAANTH